MNTPSLYDQGTLGGDPTPEPGTRLTATVETLDNDRAGLMFDAGVIR